MRLPGRTKKTEWYNRTFFDHEGKPAIRWAKQSEDDPFMYADDDDSTESLALQVYILCEVDESERDRLLSILMEDFRYDRLDYIFLDVYQSTSLNPVTAIDHQRREIQHRKAERQKRGHSGHADVSSSLIPKFPVSIHTHASKLTGFLLVITSTAKSNILSHLPNSDYHAGPLFVTFDRRLPSAITVTENDLQDPEDPESEENETELLDTEVLRYIRPDAGTISYDLYWNKLRKAVKKPDVFGAMLDGAASEDEGIPYENSLKSWTDANNVIEQNASETGLIVEECGASIIVMTDGVDARSASLRYVIYASFVHYYAGKNDLDNIARSFTTALLENLPRDKSVALEFRKPEQPTLWSCITDFFRLNSRNDDNTHEFGAFAGEESQRRLPFQNVEKYELIKGRDVWLIERPRTLFIMLDKPDFLETGTGGIAFVKIPAAMNYHHHEGESIELVRSTGMPSAARRLAMLILDEQERQ